MLDDRRALVAARRIIDTLLEVLAARGVTAEDLAIVADGRGIPLPLALEVLDLTIGAQPSRPQEARS